MTRPAPIRPNLLDCEADHWEACKNPDGEKCRECLKREVEQLGAALSRSNSVLMRLVKLAKEAEKRINEGE